MKKVLLAVAVLAASSASFAAGDHRVIISGHVFGETCVIENGANQGQGLPPISQSNVKDNAEADGLQSESQFDITLGQCSVNHLKKVSLKFDTKVTPEGYLENTSTAANAAEGVALALYENAGTDGYKFLNLKENLGSKKEVHVQQHNKDQVKFQYGVDYIKTGNGEIKPGPVSSILKYDIVYK